MKIVTYKVVAYITHNNQLLVFRHTAFPEAGIQVPAGTIKTNETAETAVLREAYEETGLTNLKIKRKLGVGKHDMHEYGRNEIQHRTYFHLVCTSPPPQAWHHWEEHTESGESYEFAFFWADLPAGIPPLAGFQDAFLPQLAMRERACISYLPWLQFINFWILIILLGALLLCVDLHVFCLC